MSSLLSSSYLLTYSLTRHHNRLTHQCTITSDIARRAMIFAPSALILLVPLASAQAYEKTFGFSPGRQEERGYLGPAVEGPRVMADRHPPVPKQSPTQKLDNRKPNKITTPESYPANWPGLLPRKTTTHPSNPQSPTQKLDNRKPKETTTPESYPANWPGLLPHKTTTRPSDPALLDEYTMRLVNFGVAQLAGGGPMGCLRKINKVEDIRVADHGQYFTVEVVPVKGQKGCPDFTPFRCTMLVDGYNDVLKIMDLTCKEQITRMSVIGAPIKVTHIGDGERAMAEFAVAQLAAHRNDTCDRKIMKIENYTEQLVAGMSYEFDVVVAPHDIKKHECASVLTEKCHMVVWVKDFENDKEVQWNRVECTKNLEKNPIYKPAQKPTYKPGRKPTYRPVQKTT